MIPEKDIFNQPPHPPSPLSPKGKPPEGNADASSSSDSNKSYTIGKAVLHYKEQNKDLNPKKFSAAQSSQSSPPAKAQSTQSSVPANIPSPLHPSTGKAGEPHPIPKAGENHGVLPIVTRSPLDNEMRKLPIHMDPLLRHLPREGITKESVSLSFQNQPIGAWRIYVSKEKGRIVVSVKTGKSEIKTFEKISIEGKEKPLESCSIGEIREHFGENKLLYKTLSYGPNEKYFCLPPTPFIPHFYFDCKTPENFQNFLNDWKSSGIGDNFKIFFDEKNHAVIIGHSEKELMSLVDKNEFLEKYFGSSSYPVFKGYGARFTFEYASVGLLNDPSLLEECSNAFYKRLHPVDFDLSIPPITNITAALHQILTRENFAGIILGEMHEDQNPKKFLIEHMQNLRNEGVKTLFLEFLPYDTMQELLDEYFKSPYDEMPPVLEALLANRDEYQTFVQSTPYVLKEVVREAKRSGIRVVGLETTASLKIGDRGYIAGQSGPERAMGFNFQAQDIIKREAGGGKFVALVGNTHATTTHQIPGLSEILGVPNIVFDKGQTAKFEYNVRNFMPQKEGDEKTRSDSGGGHVHILISAPDNQSFRGDFK